MAASLLHRGFFAETNVFGSGSKNQGDETIANIQHARDLLAATSELARSCEKLQTINPKPPVEKAIGVLDCLMTTVSSVVEPNKTPQVAASTASLFSKTNAPKDTENHDEPTTPTDSPQLKN
jgi:hypothetical protein